LLGIDLDAFRTAFIANKVPQVAWLAKTKEGTRLPIRAATKWARSRVPLVLSPDEFWINLKISRIARLFFKSRPNVQCDCPPWNTRTGLSSTLKSLSPASSAKQSRHPVLEDDVAGLECRHCRRADELDLTAFQSGKRPMTRQKTRFIQARKTSNKAVTRTDYAYLVQPLERFRALFQR